MGGSTVLGIIQQSVVVYTTFAELRYQSLHVMAYPAYYNYMTSLLYDSKLRTQWKYHNNA